MNDGLCFIGVNGAKMMQEWDMFRPTLRAMFRETVTNICVGCAEALAYKWAEESGMPPYNSPPDEIWAEVIRQMDRGKIDGNPFARRQFRSETIPNPRAGLDYRSGPQFFGKLTDKCPCGCGKDVYSCDDLSCAPTFTSPVFSFQQANRYRDERAAAWARNVQDLELNRSFRLDEYLLKAIDPQYWKVLHNSENAYRFPWPPRSKDSL